jgi:hypothetical protein
MKQKVTVLQAINDLKKVFGVTDKGFSSVVNGTFFIDRRQYEKSDVMFELTDYFLTREIEDGFWKFVGQTMNYTIFEINS